MAKIVAFSGSPRKNGNTDTIIDHLLNVLKSNGHEVEMVRLKREEIRGCRACGVCREKKDLRCYSNNDFLNECISKMVDADGIIFGSPVYFANVTTEMKALIDVSGYVTRSAGHVLARKVGASVVAVRRAGEMSSFDAMNNFFLINQMIVPGSSYWNIVQGKQPGDVLNDTEGMATITTLGENMSWLLDKVVPSKKKVKKDIGLDLDQPTLF
ncbi:flavodoxin family protein [Halosquirtibacter xylanolyticus]|uniref:flavodoxin family protein n=1 Tax=Halosquirtibacter xylanolyticus TaxID=3374599 RepID=UPI0037485FB7|nr:flavodoxin family protein [Prolixibacteraceae bacterium]